MAKKKNTDDSKPSILQRLRKKVRVVVVNMDTYEEKRHFILSGMNTIVLVLFVLILIGGATYVSIAYTPLKRTIPGYPTAHQELQVKQVDLENLKYIEGLKDKSKIEDLYYSNIEAILNDQFPIDPTANDSLSKADSLDVNNISFKISKEDSLLREKIAEREKYSLTSSNLVQTKDNDLKGMFLFPPINGTVSDPINISEGHFGVDIIAPKDEAVKATLAGTIVFTDWTPENGHVVHVQHAHNLLSIYKHNSFILKNLGDIVDVGEPIAIIGNTGELSSGTHLHFELWHQGTPLNPEEFIAF